MTSYTVHLYPVIRVKMYNVEAATPKMAAEKAWDSVDLHRMFPDRTPNNDVKPDGSCLSFSAGYAEGDDDTMVKADDSEEEHWFDQALNEIDLTSRSTEISAARLERRQQVLVDIKKVIIRSKDLGKWYWLYRGDEEFPENWQGPFVTFWLTLCDATEPYFEESDEGA